jgi:LuxR family maltose regulon positive regulatory protein
MLAPILSSKITVPPVESRLLYRSRLHEQLEQVASSRITLISAPAGYGKTTLISSWIERIAAPAAWVSLEPDDNALSKFWCCVAASLEEIQPGISAQAQKIFQSFHGASPEQAVSYFLNAIERISRPCILVLDDYHIIDNPLIHESLSFFLEHLPHPIHLVIVSRNTPPFSLSRYRIRGELLEIGVENLRFTVDEVLELFERSNEYKVNYEEAVLIEQKTEGWAAALKVITLSMPRQKELTGFFQAFSGKHRFLLDYFIEEVFQKQSEDVQSFLLQTSIVDKINSSLCRAVTDNPNCSKIIAYLEQANVFITRLDDERAWYRYHPLFAEALRNRLQEHPMMAATVDTLHRRASYWYDEHGYGEPAVRHALAVKDYELACKVISSRLDLFISQGQEMIVLHWLDAMPPQIVLREFALRSFYTAMLYVAGRPVDKILTELERLLAEEGDPMSAQERREMEYHITGMKAAAALMRYQLAEFQFHMIALSSYRNIRMSRTDFISQNEAVLHRGVTAYGGRLSKALRVNLTTNSDPRTIRNDLLYFEGRNKLTLADIYYEMNLLAEASIELTQLGHILDSSLNSGIVAPGLILSAKIKRAEGHAAEALQRIRHGEYALKKRGMQRGELLLEAFRVKLELLNGHIESAMHWAKTRHLRTEDQPHVLREFEYLIYARLLLIQNRAEEARTLLFRMLEAAEKWDRYGSRIEILLLISLCWYKDKHTGQMLETLKQALVLASAEGYRRIFLDEGRDMAHLLELGLQHWRYRDHGSDELDAMVSYAEGVLNQFSHEPEGNSLLTNFDRPKVSLSDRELEVLKYLDKGYSNEEIAGELYLSVGTVKRYIHDMFVKLEVKNRVQATIRARELNIL